MLFFCFHEIGPRLILRTRGSNTHTRENAHPYRFYLNFSYKQILLLLCTSLKSPVYALQRFDSFLWRIHILFILLEQKKSKTIRRLLIRPSIFFFKFKQRFSESAGTKASLRNTYAPLNCLGGQLIEIR